MSKSVIDYIESFYNRGQFHLRPGTPCCYCDKVIEDGALFCRHTLRTALMPASGFYYYHSNCRKGMRTPIKIGDKGRTELPASEVCIHMRVTGNLMDFEVVASKCMNGQVAQPVYPMVQLLQADGQPFSAPILLGEAGIYRDGEEMYYYQPEPLKGKPEIQQPPQERRQRRPNELYCSGLGEVGII